MFLPLLTASQTANGDGMLGFQVQVYTDDDLVYTYVISKVKRHSEDFSIASSVAADAQQLVLQTSEGPTPGAAQAPGGGDLRQRRPGRPRGGPPDAPPADLQLVHRAGPSPSVSGRRPMNTKGG